VKELVHIGRHLFWADVFKFVDSSPDCAAAEQHGEHCRQAHVTAVTRHCSNSQPSLLLGVAFF
jgi:hypothetical protein